MQVIATAGHVDHGKSTLVRALTGMEPDRWAEERRRGLTIDLGYAWLTLPSGQRVAFVDVPGHERFVPNMLAGVGPVPAVLFAVAADSGWMPQSEEHLAAIDALGISRGLLVVTRADLADPGKALAAAGDRMARSSLGALPSVAVSAVTGRGIPELLAALDRLVSGLPTADAAAPVRLWVDRAFSIRGSGTVVTGTLPAGTVRTRDQLRLTPGMRPVTVRAIQSLKEAAAEVSGVARVALNLRGVDARALARGMALVTPGAWTLTSVVDVRLGPAVPGPGAPGTLPGEPESPDAQVTGRARPPGQLMLHVGAARTAARVRLLGGRIARLTLAEALPLHVGDRVLLRVPGAPPATDGDTPRPTWPPLTGASVLDVAPPTLTGRGAAAAAARELSAWPDPPHATDLLHRHGLLRLPALRAMGAGESPPPALGEWLADPGYWAALRDRLARIVSEHAVQHPLAPGMPLEAARAALGVPDRHLVEALAPGGLVVTEGVLRAAPAVQPAAGTPPRLPEPLLAAVTAVCKDLADAPFLAPEASRLRDLGLEPKALAAAARAGLLLRVSDQIVLAPGADARAAEILAGLPQPFTTAQARQALNTTRRVAIPLLEHLDRAGITQRLPDDRRRLRHRASG